MSAGFPILASGATMLCGRWIASTLLLLAYACCGIGLSHLGWRARSCLGVGKGGGKTLNGWGKSMTMRIMIVFPIIHHPPPRLPHRSPHLDDVFLPRIHHPLPRQMRMRTLPVRVTISLFGLPSEFPSMSLPFLILSRRGRGTGTGTGTGTGMMGGGSFWGRGRTWTQTS